MTTLTRLEDLFFGLLAFYLFVSLHFTWWLFFVLLLAPDISMLGYALNTRVGAIVYNLIHHRGLSIAIFIAGSVLHTPWMQAAALILLAHSSFDRVLGYGLKYPDSFQHTHLGFIGRPNKA
ncbi:MAG: DUF4260 domain-containing protein [Anaerolineae bacterium]